MGKGCSCGTTRAGEVHLPYVKQEQLEAGLWEICSYTLGLVRGHRLVLCPGPSGTQTRSGVAKGEQG